MSFGDADLAMMLSDAFAVPVILPGAVQTMGLESFHDDVQFSDDGSSRVVGRIRAVTLLTSMVGSLTDGDSVTVNGVARKVRGQPMANGSESLVYLRG